MFKLELSTGNRAFEENPNEVADILRKLANHLEDPDSPINLHGSQVVFDHHGNSVGTATKG